MNSYRNFRLFILIFLSSFLGLNELRAQDFLEGWKFRQEVLIDNSGSDQPLVDRSVKITLATRELIVNQQMDPEGKDLRFTDIDGVSPLCFWPEHDFSGATTEIWIRIPEVPARSWHTVYCYYGKDEVTAAGDPDCAFLLFDDFNGEEPDTSRWEIAGSGEIRVANGEALFKAESDDIFLRSKATFSRPVIVEMKVNKAKGKFPSLAVVKPINYLWLGNCLSADLETNSMQLGQTEGDPTQCGGPFFYPDLTPEKLDAYKGIWSLTWLTANEVMAQWPGGNLITENNTLETDDLQMALGLASCPMTTARSGVLVVDWVRVRQYSAMEPAIFLGPAMGNPALGTASPEQNILIGYNG